MNIYKSPGVHTIEFDIPKWLLRMNRIESVFKLNYTKNKVPTGVVFGSTNTAIGSNSIVSGSTNTLIGSNSTWSTNWSTVSGSHNISYGYSSLYSKKYKRIDKIKNIWKET